MKHSSFIIGFPLIILLMFSCQATPKSSVDELSTFSNSDSKLTGYDFNLIVFTGEESGFTYPLDSTKFFSDNIAASLNIVNKTMLNEARATLSNVVDALVPFSNDVNIINIIVYAGHASTNYIAAAGESISYQRFIEQIEKTVANPTLVILGSCFSGNASKFLSPETKIALYTSSQIGMSSSSGGNNGVELSVLGSIVYAFSNFDQVDNDKDHSITASELAKRAMVIANENSEKHGWYEGNKWANFGVYFWGNDLILGAY